MADSGLDDWTTKVLNKVKIYSQTPSDFSNTHTGIKLDGSNYAPWSQVVEMYISGRDKLGYITSDSPQPLETDPSFWKWRTENAIIKGWLINSMDPSLIGKQGILRSITPSYRVYVFLDGLDDRLDKI